MPNMYCYLYKLLLSFEVAYLIKSPIILHIFDNIKIVYISSFLLQCLQVTIVKEMITIHSFTKQEIDGITNWSWVVRHIIP